MSGLSATSIELLSGFRKILHQYPELSGHETKTSQHLKHFLEKLNPDKIYTHIGGNGLVVVFDSGKPGPSVLLRADIDALPITESNKIPYKSVREGVSHKCGHDGHMTILSGVAVLLSAKRPAKGRVYLLFQPEEETGTGAEKVLKNKLFEKIKPDWVFALHNLPGFEKKSVIVKEGPFAAASKGMIIHLEGRSSHAAHPEQGNSPVRMMTDLIDRLIKLPEEKETFKGFSLLTIIHATLGEIAFGTNPGNAVVMATLRTYYDSDMLILTQKAQELTQRLSQHWNIKTRINFTEEFPATNNDAEATSLIKKAARHLAYPIVEIDEAFRWSEDFGHFTGKYKGALFGLGSGINHPGLHNDDYDFPDELIKPGAEMFYHLIQQILSNKNI